MAIAEVTIAPLGTGSPSVSRYVAECHKVLAQEKGLKYQLTPIMPRSLRVIWIVFLRLFAKCMRSSFLPPEQ